MSAEKEIVNFWCNKRGFFTINNIKTSSNRDVGILALKFRGNKVEEINHIEVSCSIIGSIGENANAEDTVTNIIQDRFENKDIHKALKEQIKGFDVLGVNRYIVIGGFPKSRKKEIIRGFKENHVEVIEFENVLREIFGDLDTQYYKNDVLRTLQLVKYLFLSGPKNLSDLLITDVFSPAARNEFLNSMLDKEEIVKEFRKTNEERLTAILRNSSLRDPEKLAEMIENNILNKRTRKPFLSSLLGQEKIKKIVIETDTKKHEIPLINFFENT
ncbi:hypothetical protein HYX09_04365 [Candidatus Woesearchaeota archaeon]|nr:hypothetical protein [Candidatus Woesearchaeota archaeon]